MSSPNSGSPAEKPRPHAPISKPPHVAFRGMMSDVKDKAAEAITKVMQDKDMQSKATDAVTSVAQNKELQAKATDAITSVAQKRDRSFHEELAFTNYTEYEEAAAEDILTVDFLWFEKRCNRIQIALCFVIIAVTSLAGIANYVCFIVPKEIFALNVTKNVLLGRNGTQFFNCWLAIVVGYAIIVYIWFIMLHPQPNKWKIFGKYRTCLGIALELYLFSVLVTYTVNLGWILPTLKGAMEKDLYKNDGKNFEYSQKYFECCGIQSSKDWSVHYTNYHVAWHGDACSNPDKIKEYGLNERVCKVPPSCWRSELSDDKDDDDIDQNHPLENDKNDDVDDKNDKEDEPESDRVISVYEDNCLSWEVALPFSVCGIFIFILAAVLISTSAILIYIRSVVEFANRKKIELKSKYTFEECF